MKSHDIHAAALALDRPAILTAIASGQDPSALDSLGRSPLVCVLDATNGPTCPHLSAARRNVCLRTLLDAGARPDAMALRMAPREWRDELANAAFAASFSAAQRKRGREFAAP